MRHSRPIWRPGPRSRPAANEACGASRPSTATYASQAPLSPTPSPSDSPWLGAVRVPARSPWRPAHFTDCGPYADRTQHHSRRVFAASSGVHVVIVGDDGVDERQQTTERGQVGGAVGGDGRLGLLEGLVAALGGGRVAEAREVAPDGGHDRSRAGQDGDELRDLETGAGVAAQEADEARRAGGRDVLAADWERGNRGEAGKEGCREGATRVRYRQCQLTRRRQRRGGR